MALCMLLLEWSSALAQPTTSPAQAPATTQFTKEQQIDQLKYQKAAIPTDQYRSQLQALLLELAKTQEELEK